MAHGQPDFGVYAVKETVSGLADLGELAARLGSIDTFDRLGDVVWFDDFEGDLNMWTKGGSGANPDAYITAESAHRGSFSCKLITGSTLGKTSEIVHYGHGLVFSKIGVEVAFTAHADLDFFRVTIRYSSKPTFYEGQIICYLVTDLLKYEVSDGVEATFATDVALGQDDKLYHILKFVVDLPNAKYGRVLLNDLSYDLSDKSLRTGDTIHASLLKVTVETGATPADNVESFIDDVIVTQNEP